MKTIITTIFVLLSVVVLIAGKWHYDNKVEATVKQAIEKERQFQEKETQQEEKKKLLYEKNKNNSMMDWLRYMSTQKDEVVISVFGSSVTSGSGASSQSKSWHGLLGSYLSKQSDMPRIKIVNNGLGGYGTQQLIKENKVDDVIKAKPDLVIIEPCLINNYFQNVSLDQTNDDLKILISEIKKNLPETIIIVQSSNPIAITTDNKIGLSYNDYNESIKMYAEKNKLNFIDTYNEIDRLRAENNKKVEDILSDDRHPNDLGYEYWFEVIKQSFEKKKITN